MPPRIISQQDKIWSKNNSPPVQRPGGQNSLQRANCTLPLHNFTIDGNVSANNRFTIRQFHHITITPYNYFNISPYVRKILIHHNTIWKTKKIAPFHPETILTHSNHPTISPLHHIMFYNFTILIGWYKCEPIRYNKKRSDIKTISKYNLNFPVDPYKHSSGDIKIIKQTILLQKIRHQPFKNFSRSQMK